MTASNLLDPEGVHLAAFRRLADFKGMSLCEAGCGDGRLTLGIARDAAHVFAFDPDEQAIERARAGLPAELADRVTYEAGRALEIELPRLELDLVVFSWSL